MTRTLVLALLLAAGCGGGAHLSENHGKRTGAHFAGQRVAAEAAKEAPAGLDSEEASLIQQRYRETLGAPRARTAEPGSRVLLIEEPARAPRK